MAKHLILLTAIGWLGCMAACSESKFASSNDAKGKKSDPGTGTGDPGTGTGNPGTGTGGPGGSTGGPPTINCTEGDKANFNPGGDAGKCITDGDTYNFDGKECQKMRRSEFDCSFEGLFAAMKEMGLSPTPKLKQFKDDGAKMISCGQNKDKTLVVSQILIPPEGGFKCVDGKVNNGTVLTGCYQSDGGLKEGASADEQKKYVYSCIEKTND